MRHVRILVNFSGRNWYPLYLAFPEDIPFERVGFHLWRLLKAALANREVHRADIEGICRDQAAEDKAIARMHEERGSTDSAGVQQL